MYEHIIYINIWYIYICVYSQDQRHVRISHVKIEYPQAKLSEEKTLFVHKRNVVESRQYLEKVYNANDFF